MASVDPTSGSSVRWLGNYARHSQTTPDMATTTFKDFHNPWVVLNFFKEEKLSIVRWFQEKHLLAKQIACPTCGRPCTLNVRTRRVDGCTFRCDGGLHEYSVRVNSYFKNFRYSFADVLLFVFNLLDGLTLKQNALKIGLSYSNAAPRWAMLARLIMAERVWLEYFADNINTYTMSGFVQCDESRFGRKVKANTGCPRGRCVWMAGLIESETGRLLLLPVQNR